MDRKLKITDIFYYNNLWGRLTGNGSNKDFNYVFLPEKSDSGYTWRFCNVEKMVKNFRVINAPPILTDKEEHELLLSAF